MSVAVPAHGPSQNVPAPCVITTGAPVPVFGRVSVAGSSPEMLIEPPGETKPFDTPSTGASTVVVSLATGPAPGDATAEFVMEPPAGTVLGLVTTSRACADAPTASAPSVQSTGPLPVQPPGAFVETSVVPA